MNVPGVDADAQGRAGRWPFAILIAVVFCLVHLVFVLPLHTVPVPYEYDDYHGIADGLRAGRLVPDPYHTFLYPLLVAGLTSLCDNALTAARVVSALAASGALLAVASLAAQLRGPRVGVAAALLVAVNPWFLTFAALSSSDMLATAFGLTSLAQLAKHLSARTRGSLWFAAIAAGLAVGARYSMMPLALVVASAAAWAARDGERSLVRAASGLWRALAGFAIGYAPHGVLAAICYGSPFHNLAWQNMALKTLHGWDSFAYDPAALPPLPAFLAQHGGQVLAAAWPDCCALALHGFGNLLTGCVLPPALGLLATGFVAVALVLAAARRAFAPAAVFAVLHALLMCVTFRMDCRVLLPVLPVVAAAVVVLPWARGSSWLGPAALALAIAAQAAILPDLLRRQLDQAPEAEVAVARDLPRRLGRTPVLASSYMLMRQVLPFRALYIPAPPADAPPAAHWQRLRDVAMNGGCDTFLIGRRTASLQFRALVEDTVPAGFSVLQRDDEVLLLAFAHPGSPSIEDVVVETVAAAGGELRLSFTSAASLPLETVAGAGFLLVTDNGTTPMIELKHLGEGRWEHRGAPPAPGDYEFVPFLLLRDGSVQRGRSVRVSLGR